MKPILIILDGPMGAEKTTIGKLLHQELKGFAKIGLDIIKWFVSGFSRTNEENIVAGKIVQSMCTTYLQNNVSVILDSGFKKSELMIPYLEIAEKLWVESFVYQIEAPINILIERIISRPKPELADTKVSMDRTVKNIDSYFDNKYDSPRKIFDSSILSSEEIVKKIIQDCN